MNTGRTQAICLQVGHPSRSKCSSLMTLLRAKTVMLAGWHSTSHITSHSSPECESLQDCSALQVCVVRCCMCPCSNETAQAGKSQLQRSPFPALHSMNRALLQPHTGPRPGLQSSAPNAFGPPPQRCRFEIQKS